MRDKSKFSKNIKWLASNFSSYNELRAHLKVDPKFVSRAITSPHELSIDRMKMAGAALGIDDDTLFGNLETFQRTVSWWVFVKAKTTKKGEKTSVQEAWEQYKDDIFGQSHIEEREISRARLTFIAGMLAVVGHLSSKDKIKHDILEEASAYNGKKHFQVYKEKS